MTIECIFCKIVAEQAPARILHRDSLITAFQDIHPSAPTHILIAPNKHIASLNELAQEDLALMGQLIWTARDIAEREGIKQSGYRLVINTGREGGQSVFHLHVHLIGGRPLSFRM